MPELNQEKPENFKGNESPSETNFNSKKTFFLVGIIGVAALFLGFLQIYNYIHSPFRTTLTLNSTTHLTNEQLGQIENLKAKDTDGDGLSDYDELYYYGTSPYLKDSDSDGFSDKEEMESGNDPNCPAGYDCTGSATTEGEGNTNSSSANQNSNNSLVSGNATAEALRDTLKNAGVPQYILDSTSDEDLLEIYNQTVSETSAPAVNANTSESSNKNESAGEVSGETEITDEELTEMLRTMTPEEIRQLLVEYGLSEEELSQVDDATLQAIFMQALEEG